ncbi:MAG: prephenate dehydrogenase/arogenate dehydrogenase family protein [Acidobacteriota bacterium]
MSVPSPFHRIGVAGLGLIGGSVAMAARERFPDVIVRGCDEAPRFDAARARGAISDGGSDVRALADCDLIVVAVPLAAMREVLMAIAESGTSALVTDVGSTKRHVMNIARGAHGLRFIGGHPMAGRERPGLDQADADLFVDRPWLLVQGTADAESDARLESFVRALGARARWMEAAAHDRAVAFVSHLPQILGAALMAAADAGIGEDGVGVAGPAFGEMTRLASSPPEMWHTVLAENADFVAEALAGLSAELPTVADLQSGTWVRDVLTRAGSARGRWQRKDG